VIVRVRSLCTAAAVSVLAAACVTVYDDAEADEPGSLELPAYAVAQTIPLGKSGSSPEERLLLQFYGGVLERLQEAADDHDSAALFGLLEAYDKPNLPEWLAGRLRGYRALGHGLAFLEHAASDSRLTLVTDPAAGAAGDAAAIAPAIGAPVHFEFSLPAGPRPVRLGGRAGDDPIGFAIAITIDDLYVDGGSRTQSDQDFQWLDEAFPLDEGAVLRLPLSFAIPVGKAVRRRIHLRVDLMPGYIQDGEQRAPVERRTLAATTLTQWPAGYEPIAQRPLATLREALRLGDPQHFAHVFLGASFAEGADREAAIGLLVDQVRFGGARQALVAMATLRAVTGAEIPIGEREAWLAWANVRR